MLSSIGQWTGYSEGVPDGKVICDCEIRDGLQKAVAYLFSESPKIPSTVIEFNFPEYQEAFELDVKIHAFDTHQGRLLRPDEIAGLFPGIQFSETAKLKFQRKSADLLEVRWSTAVGTNGFVSLSRSRVPKTSELPMLSTVTSWKEFKEKVSEFRFSEFVFRGQSRRYPLQTSFHRTERKILHYYLDEDVPSLHRSITGKTAHLFDLERPQQFGAFLNLAQHHGYPTPLLDWTFSPYVAAWFAFSGALKDIDSEEPVRILCFDKKEYSTLQQMQNLTFAPPHFSILEALAIENDRAIPQQGLLKLTNVQDVETFLTDLELSLGKTFLTAIDLPRSETLVVLNELAMMGITRSTMFPSIESICLDAREKMF